MFFSNLLLAGFDPAAHSARHNIQFHASMFERTNTKGMQVVLYYLFLHLNHAQCKEVRTVGARGTRARGSCWNDGGRGLSTELA